MTASNREAKEGFAKLVNDQGVSAYKIPFDEAMAMMEENVSCYTCHGNEAGEKGKLVVTHSYVTKALGANAEKIDPATLSCGQCHIEYYFTPADKETMMPYSSVEEMTPEAILASKLPADVGCIVDNVGTMAVRRAPAAP